MDSTIYIYTGLFKNTCLMGHFMYLKIENHRAYGPLLFLPPPSRDCISDSNGNWFWEFFAPALLNEFLICEANICGAPRGKRIFVWELSKP